MNSPASSQGSEETGWSRQGPAKSPDFSLPLAILGTMDGSPWIHVLSMGEEGQDASKRGVVFECKEID